MNDVPRRPARNRRRVPVSAAISGSLVVLVLVIALASLSACRAAETATPPPTITSIPSPSPPTSTPSPSPTAPPALPQATLIRGPYLQSVTASSIIVVWETDIPGPGEVVYGETLEYGSSAADPIVGARHAVTLTHLTTYTSYRYRVESGGVPLSDEATFRTAAGPDQNQFTFVAFGDTRTQHDIHQTVIDRISAMAPDFALHTGDLVAMGSAAPQWETFFEIERDLMARIPLYPTLGNHELNHQRYFDLFYLPGNERWYSFDYGNARFVCLQVDGYAEYGPGSEQYTWLEQALTENTQPWLFVFFHIPPYTSSEDWDEHRIRQALTPLFERHGVDVVFGGHHHNYERNEVNGVTYVVTGGGGAPLCVMQEPESTRAAFAVAYHAVLLEIDGDRLRATVVSNKGKVLDEFERTHP